MIVTGHYSMFSLASPTSALRSNPKMGGPLRRNTWTGASLLPVGDDVIKAEEVPVLDFLLVPPLSGATARVLFARKKRAHTVAPGLARMGPVQGGPGDRVGRVSERAGAMAYGGVRCGEVRGSA